MNNSVYGKEIIKTHYTTFGKVTKLLAHKAQETPPTYHYEPIDVRPEYGYLESPRSNIESDNKQEASDILTTPPIESVNLSIEAKEKELIIIALQQFKHNRKQAAKELGISERTLYRKIKQYHLI